MAPWAGRRGRGQAGGPRARGTGGVLGLPGPDRGGRLQARRSGHGEIGSIARQPGRLGGFGGGARVIVGRWGGGRPRRYKLWKMKFLRQGCEQRGGEPLSCLARNT